MFERRVRVLLTILAVAVVVIVLRLVDLQIIHADIYREQAAEALLYEPESLPFVRGRILDRTGLLLASDEPNWEIRVDYGVLAMSDGYLDAMTRRLRRRGRYGQGLDQAQVEAAFRAEIEDTWAALAAFSGEHPLELERRADEIVDRIRRIRDLVSRRAGYDTPIAEERVAHAVLSGLDDQQQIAARELLGGYPWVRIEVANQRVYHEAECLAHVLGRTGRVTVEHVADDPHADDRLRRYLPDETVGLTGVEKAAEDVLRGRRGWLHEDRKGRILEDIAPEDGQDVYLTIHYELQHRLYDLLGRELPRLPHSPGGSIVVLDVATRDVLALVSYPSYDPNRFNDRTYYNLLRSDTVRMPLRFRAVSNRYAPGSIVKPLTCLAGLSSGRIGLNTRFDCTGYLFPENPRAGASKCWPVAGTTRRMAHGSVDVVEALEGSCNIYMYQVGIAVGVDYLCNFFHMVGFGDKSGIGLREETKGINPTPAYLSDRLNRPVRPADARLYAIGQGELAVTPVQAANLMATYAASEIRRVRLLRHQHDAPVSTIPAEPAFWRAIHRGLYRVVNSRDGTAYKYARLDHERYALCGKTGTATTPPIPTAFRVEYVDPDGQQRFTVLRSGDRGNAIKDLKRLRPEAEIPTGGVSVAERYPPGAPPGGGRHAHAWFGGYLQRLDSNHEPLFEITPKVAFAVLIEFGGSGGRTSGPIAREVARVLIDTLGEDLDPDLVAEEPGP